MRSIIGKLSWALSAVVMISVFGQTASAQNENSAASPLVGTWQVTVTLRNCQTGDPIGAPPFSSILTFARGGTMAEDTINPSYAPGQRGSGEGVWQTISNKDFYARSVAFITYSGGGWQAGQQIIDQTITYDASTDGWNAVAVTMFTDMTGTVYRQGCSTAKAIRF